MVWVKNSVPNAITLSREDSQGIGVEPYSLVSDDFGLSLSAIPFNRGVFICRRHRVPYPGTVTRSSQEYPTTLPSNY